jgi:hypothetical protein
MKLHGPGHFTAENHPDAQRVTVAVYAHEEGEETRVFATDGGAEIWRRFIADEYWPDMFDDPRPNSGAETANRYFDRCGEAGLEFFTTQTVVVET